MWSLEAPPHALRQPKREGWSKRSSHAASKRFQSSGQSLKARRSLVAGEATQAYATLRVAPIGRAGTPFVEVGDGDTRMAVPISETFD